MNYFLILISLTLNNVFNEVIGNKKVVCYYGTWATYRHGFGKFDVSNIEPSLCTHIVYTFVGITHTGDDVLVLDPYLDLPDNWGRDNFGAFNSLKELNPDVKTILAIGGWNEGSAKYSKMANDPIIRKKFVENVTKFVLKYNFNGLDMDWEYPNRRDSIHGYDDIEAFTNLLLELREAFDQHDLELSAAVSSVKEMASLSYDIPRVCSYLDMVGIMTYDMRGAWDTITGHNSPLYTSEGDFNVLSDDDAYTVSAAVQYWLNSGCPPEKIIMGVPFYGRTFSLSNVNEHQVGAPSNGAGLAGPFTQQNGVIGYNEFCVKLQSESWTEKYDPMAKVPYAVKENNWISYDNIDSIRLKVQYAVSKQLAGIMIWSIETDDFHGLCNNGVFPLLHTINEEIARDVPEPITTTTKSPETTNSSTVAPSIPGVICQSEGYVKDPMSCSNFYYCLKNPDNTFLSYAFSCPKDLFWDEYNLHCDYAENVTCTIE